MIRKSILTIIFFVFILNLSGCLTLFGPNKSRVDLLPPYSGPKARASVVDFDIKTPKASSEVSSGLREMLVKALVSTNRFSIVDRQELKTDEKAKSIIIATTILEFKPQDSGGSAGIGGGGGENNGLFGGLLGDSLNKAHMALDIHLVDVSTSEVLATKQISGQATDSSSVGAGVSLANVSLGKGLSAYADTAVEKAIRICISEAARYIAETVPAEYYKN